MADVFTREERSEIMSRIRSSGTTTEARLYASVREALGGRWRIDKNVRTLPGQPDVVVPARRVAVFADSASTTAAPSTATCRNRTSNIGSRSWPATAGATGRAGGPCGRWASPCGDSVKHELKRIARTHLALKRKLKARIDLQRSRKGRAHAEAPARRLRQG